VVSYDIYGAILLEEGIPLKVKYIFRFRKSWKLSVPGIRLTPDTRNPHSD
jgi:hypothetical protein